MRAPSLFAAFLPLFHFATALPNITGTLLPWEITSLGTFSPSSYPASHPFSRIIFSISDPNNITVAPRHQFGQIGFPPTATNCSVYWNPYSEDPRKADWPLNACSEVSTAKWTFQIREGNINIGKTGTAVTRNFVAAVKLSEHVVLPTGGIWEHKYEGQASFAVGVNMAGACGGSGVCSYGLSERPVLVNQTLVSATCLIGDCDI
ncbi:hypothetical protein QBC42DRAFT_56974 [Cladorrhinum samala]|uniref:Uncharacterized protein n=1 Tax=Cladorrhinum samala TaxID=585594 RepID=A0AAV9HXK0_9PEZI|nr:hypothetical protein QBC42DRAFT_56974 [Cladorrhinum samala]